MLTQEQENHFNTFGFVILRDIFTPDDVKTIRAEFDHASALANAFKPFDGTEMHYFRMMGPETPFYTSLPEDARFYEVAEQLYGARTFAFESNGYRYVGNTRWHYNDGSSNYHGYGIKFQFGLDPVDGNTGGLRFIPGSHKPAYQDRLVEVSPLGRRFYDTQQAWDEIDRVPCYAAEYGPRDVVAFDLRIFHGTWGGSNDRQMSCVSFFHYPETPEEMETMRHITPGYLNPRRLPSMPWNDGIREQWLANAEGSAKRQSWIGSMEEISRITQAQTGLRLVEDDYHMTTLAPA